MAQIVAGVTLSHSPMIMTNREAAGAKGEGFINAAGEMRNWLKSMGTDVIVLISDDHFNSYFYDHMPLFTIGLDQCQGWGDWQLPQYDVPVQKQLARHILDTALEEGVDLAFSLKMKIDHGHTQAIYFLDSDLELPIVPIAVNTVAPPLPTMNRCYQVGEVIRKAIDSWDSDLKVAIVASGGLSHWVPIPKINSDKPEDQELIRILRNGRSEIEELEAYQKSRIDRVMALKTGPVNEEWDRALLQKIVEKDHEPIRNFSVKYIEENGGNGAHEIRNWAVAIGIMKEYNAKVVFYEPIPEWVTGMAIVQFTK